MKIDFKKILCFGLVASFGCLSAQEEPMDSSKELSMSMAHERCASEDGCRSDCLEMECQPRVDDCDYDVYTVGDECQREEQERRASCRRKESTNRCQRNYCGKQCGRRGAAKEAQE